MKRLRKVAEGNYFNAEEIRDKNMRMLEKNPDDYSKCVSFDYKGVTIVDPFMDESCTNDVDPVKYYGDAFLNSDFAR